MDRFIEIMVESQQDIRSGNYLEAWRNVRNLADQIVNSEENPIESTEQEMLEFFQSIHQIGSGCRYVTAEVACISMLISMDVYIGARKASSRMGGFVSDYVSHFFASTGVHAIESNHVNETDRDPCILSTLQRERADLEEELNDYWTDIGMLSEFAYLTVRSVERSFNRKAKDQKEYGDLNESLINRVLAGEDLSDQDITAIFTDCGLDRSLAIVFAEELSNWFDAHAKTFVVLPLGELAYLSKSERHGLQLGFFNLFYRKTGYDRLDLEDGTLLQQLPEDARH